MTPCTDYTQHLCQAVAHKQSTKVVCTVLQVSGDDTTVIQAVLACDTERLDLLKEEQALLKQLNQSQPSTAHSKGAQPNSTTPDGAQPNGMPDASSASVSDGDAARGVNGAAAKEEVPDGISKAGLAADAAETKAAAQLAQVWLTAMLLPTPSSVQNMSLLLWCPRWVDPLRLDFT